MPSSDIQTKRIAGTGSLAVGPARVRQVQVRFQHWGYPLGKHSRLWHSL
jgi:hypothetical protein